MKLNCLFHARENAPGFETCAADVIIPKYCNEWMELNLLARGLTGTYLCLHKRNNLKCEL